MDTVQTAGIAPSGPPNVLVFLCDQLRIDLLGCYGSTLVRTPHIDALARDSLVFDRAYTPTAICSPARASLMTGLYAHAHHMFNNSTPRYSYCQHLRPDAVMLQDWIAAHSHYESAYFGKWHIGPADDLFRSRFEHTQRPYPGGPPFLTNSHWHPGPALGPLVRSVAGGKAGTLDVPVERFPDVVAARYTQDFLRTRERSRPFAAFCSFPGPHSPWMVPDDFGIRYAPDDVPIWPNRADTFDGKPLSQKKLRLFDHHKNPHARDDEQLQALLACCFSYLELIDGMVGEVVATLKELGEYDRTAIVFTADHGDMAGAHGFLSKGSYMYDEIYRIPLLLKPAGGRGPGGSGRSDAPVHLMDVTATLAHLMAGQEQTTLGAEPLHGRSLLPLAEGSAPWERLVHYAEYHGDWYGHYSSRMVTDGRWKLVLNFSDLCELYDLDGDPHELVNRFYDPSLRAVRDRYFDLLRAEADRVDDGQVGYYTAAIEEELGRFISAPLSFAGD